MLTKIHMTFSKYKTVQLHLNSIFPLFHIFCTYLHKCSAAFISSNTTNEKVFRCFPEVNWPPTTLTCRNPLLLYVCFSKNTVQSCSVLQLFPTLQHCFSKRNNTQEENAGALHIPAGNPYQFKTASLSIKVHHTSEDASTSLKKKKLHSLWSNSGSFNNIESFFTFSSYFLVAGSSHKH